jgi:hypothetical protein
MVLLSESGHISTATGPNHMTIFVPTTAKQGSHGWLQRASHAVLGLGIATIYGVTVKSQVCYIFPSLFSSHINPAEPVQFSIDKQWPTHGTVTKFKIQKETCMYLFFCHTLPPWLLKSSLCLHTYSIRVNNNIGLHSIPEESIGLMDNWYTAVQNVLTPSLNGSPVSPHLLLTLHSLLMHCAQPVVHVDFCWFYRRKDVPATSSNNKGPQ